MHCFLHGCNRRKAFVAKAGAQERSLQRLLLLVRKRYGGRGVASTLEVVALRIRLILEARPAASVGFAGQEKLGETGGKAATVSNSFRSVLGRNSAARCT